MNRRRLDWPKTLAWALMVLACIALWVGIGVGIAHASPAQDAADRTAEFIGRTVKAPPLYREVIRAPTELEVDIAEVGVGEVLGVVWCATPRQTTLAPGVFDVWARAAARGSLRTFDDYLAAMVVLHELLHRGVETCTFDRYLEEGITQALTLDLFPAWCLRLFGRCDPIGNEVAYTDEVTYIRNQSGRATGGSWRARPARLWRRAFYLSDRDTRRAMIPNPGGSR